MKRKVICFSMALLFSMVLLSLPVMAVEPKPGTIIDLHNWQQYKECLTPPLIEQIKMGLSFPVVKDRPELLNPAPGYIKASERNRGKVEIGPKGELLNWVSGQPFPETDIDLKDPQAGLKVAYNHERRPKGDDQSLEKYFLKMVDPHGKERCLGGMDKSYLILQIMGRTDLGPMPEWLPNPTGIRFLNILSIDYPYDLKGTMRYMIRYDDPDKDDDIWMYIPTMRRVRRMSGAQRQDSFGGTDSTYDDIRGFDGRPGEHNWRLIGEQKILVGVDTQVPHKRKGFLIPAPRALRDCWVVEAIPKQKGYVYAKKVMWVDKGFCALPWHFMVYDHQGRLWKVGEDFNTAMRTGPNRDGGFVVLDQSYVWIDLLAKRGTVYEWLGYDENGNQSCYCNSGLTPDMFGVDVLRKRGRR